MTRGSKPQPRDKRRRLRNLLIVAAIVVLALLLGWCGRGWFGGGSSGTSAAKHEPRSLTDQSVPQSTADAAPRPSRCQIRLDATGVSIAGAVASIDDVLARCRPAGEAEVLVTGDAVYGTVEQTTAALETAGIRVLFTQRPAPREPK